MTKASPCDFNLLGMDLSAEHQRQSRTESYQLRKLPVNAKQTNSALANTSHSKSYLPKFPPYHPTFLQGILCIFRHIIQAIMQ